MVVFLGSSRNFLKMARRAPHSYSLRGSDFVSKVDSKLLGYSDPIIIVFLIENTNGITSPMHRLGSGGKFWKVACSSRLACVVCGSDFVFRVDSNVVGIL